MTDTLCPICNATFTPFSKENGFSWLVCPLCGFLQLAHQYTLDTEKSFQSDLIGNKYLAGYLEVKKFRAKNKRSLKRAAVLKHFLKTGNNILDIGSNVGFFCNAADKVGLKASGIEINKTLYDWAKKEYPNCTFYNLPLEETTFANESFDGVYCSEVIEHVIDVKSFVQKIAALLKKDGVFYLTTPSSEEYIHIKRSLDAPDHKSYFNESNIKQFLESNGFYNVKHLFSWKKGGIKLICYKK